MTALEIFHKAIDNLEATPAEVILEKAKAAFNFVYWNKGRPAHYQCKGCETKEIARLKTGSSKLVDVILHEDAAVTLVTSDRYYMKFHNR